MEHLEGRHLPAFRELDKQLIERACILFDYDHGGIYPVEELLKKKHPSGPFFYGPGQYIGDTLFYKPP